MIRPWSFIINGNGADGQTFECKGTVSCEFPDSLDEAMKETFDQLTHGRAVYGKPGVGCRGPYHIRKVTIEQVQQ